MSRAERIARAVYDVRFLLAVTIVTVLLAILVPIRQNRTTNDRLLQTAAATRATQLNNADTNRRIRDCVDPTGSCYKENQARATARAKATQETVIITNACTVYVQQGPSDRTQSEIEKDIRQCVSVRQAQSAQNRQGSP